MEVPEDEKNNLKGQDSEMGHHHYCHFLFNKANHMVKPKIIGNRIYIRPAQEMVVLEQVAGTPEQKQHWGHEYKMLQSAESALREGRLGGTEPRLGNWLIYQPVGCNLLGIAAPVSILNWQWREESEDNCSNQVLIRRTYRVIQEVVILPKRLKI